MSSQKYSTGLTCSHVANNNYFSRVNARCRCIQRRDPNGWSFHSYNSVSA